METSFVLLAKLLRMILADKKQCWGINVKNWFAIKMPPETDWKLFWQPRSQCLGFLHPVTFCLQKCATHLPDWPDRTLRDGTYAPWYPPRDSRQYHSTHSHLRDSERKEEMQLIIMERLVSQEQKGRSKVSQLWDGTIPLGVASRFSLGGWV